MTWEAFTAVFSNPFIFFVGIQQVLGGVYSFYIGDWRIGAINALVGVANGLLSTMNG